MAHFRGTMIANKSNSREVTKLAHGRSDWSLCAKLNGWNAGVRVELYVNSTGQDCAKIDLTGGSNGPDSRGRIFDGPLSS